MPTELYSKRDIERRLDFSKTLEIVEKTYVETARGRVLNPPKSTMHLGDDGEWPDMNAFSITMPAYVDWLEVAGMKWAVATWDADTETPISSRILLFDLQQGEFTSITEGMCITGVRTAMQSVVGLRHLLPSAPATIGMLGAGFQARYQLSIIDSLVDVDRFRLFDTDSHRAQDLAEELRPRIDAEIIVSDSPTDIVSSDVVVTVTNSKTPVLDERWLDDAAFVIALGSYRELPDETIRSSDHIIVDHPEQCLQRGALSDLAARGELTRDDLDGTIGSVLDDGYSTPIGADDRVVFVPIGLGSLDVSIAEHLRANKSQGGSIRNFDFVS
jgi:ornithine cyclodeaminase/alanine dehydrogenase